MPKRIRPIHPHRASFGPFFGMRLLHGGMKYKPSLPFSATGDRLLQLPEAAETLAVSPKTVRRLIDFGKLPSVRIAGRRLVKLSDIQRLIELSAA